MYTHRLRGMMSFVWVTTVLLLTQSLAYAEIPAPDIKNTSVNATSSYDKDNGLFTYRYDVSSDINNEGVIASISLDIKTDFNIHRTNPLPNHPAANALMLDITRKKGIRVLPVDQQRKPGWAHFPMTAKGYAAWAAGTPSSIRPGETTSGFTLTSQFPPGVRKMRIRPGIHEYGLYAKESDSDEKKQEMHDFVESLNKYVYTLGPVKGTLGGFSQWNQFRDDLNKSIELGWIQDATLASIMVGQLTSAREAMDSGDGTLAKSRLQTLIDQVTNSTESQRRSEAYGLILSNSQSLIKWTTDTPIPFEPKLTLTHSVSKLPIGVQHTVTAKVVNVAYNDAPVPGITLLFTVTEGPNEGLSKLISTDENGEAVFSYIGKNIGTDKIEVKEPTQES